MKITVAELKSLVKEAVMEMGYGQKPEPVLSQDDIRNIIHDVLDGMNASPAEKNKAVAAFNQALQHHKAAIGGGGSVSGMSEAAVRKAIKGMMEEAVGAFRQKNAKKARR